ncbi:MAG: succinate dehydrogenase cytochrome b subunit [Planctomycetota bacterium]|nr:succinate dehydrogenase cytochrome b subunit [Planctomycetota bacterium]
MLRWIDRFANSSIGRKALMAVTGLLLIGFLLAHVAGNLTLYADQDGSAFNAYVESISALPILPLAEAGLALLFLVHIYLAVRTTLENRKARPVAYQATGTHGQKTLASTGMFVSGVVILGFLIKHLLDFRLRKAEFDEAPHESIVEAFQHMPTVAIYVVGCTALGFHLFHAIQSAAQTLGFNHPKYTPAILWFGRIFGIVLALLFASFPLVYMVKNGGTH